MQKCFLFLVLLTVCYSSELFEEYYAQAEEYLKNMTIEEKVGQMFFPRYDPNKSLDDIKNMNLGGLVLYARDFNYEDSYIQNYIKKLQAISLKYTKLPLGLAVDEEGGYVTRVSLYKRKEGQFPFPQRIYNESGIEGILKTDQEKRDLLRKYFLNVNLAPVADVSYNKDDYIYDRTLGKSPEETAEYIEKDVEGYVNDSFTCCAKHFPGYGNNVNTHDNIAYDNRSYDTFLNEDFLPFEAAIAKKIPMILVSHNIIYCQDEKYPASISKTWHDILREDLNYSGLIVTDDLYMDAIRKYSYGESSAVLAVKAGNDIILSTDYHSHVKEVIDAVKANNITEETINTACKRIIAWKLQYLNFTMPEYEEETDDGNTKSDDNKSDNTDNKSDNTALIVSLSVVGGIIIIALIIFFILHIKKEERSSSTIEEGTALLKNQE